MSKSITSSGSGGSKTPTIGSSRGGIKGYVHDVQREAKKVDWPSRKETTRLTGIVLAVVAGIVTTLFILSTIIDQVLNVLLHKGGH